MVSVGDIVKIQGLVGAPQHNGKTGVVLKKNEKEDDPSDYRFQVYALSNPRLPNCLSVKPANLEKQSQNEREKVEGWPQDWTQERQFLVSTFGWKNPHILGGVEHPGRAKPCWMFYYDADDTVSPVNETAANIASSVPGFEHSKVQPPKGGDYRGMCILVYSPMVSNGVMTSAESEKWSLEEVRGQVLEWHGSEAGRGQYQAHDNPMHRVFGGAF